MIGGLLFSACLVMVVAALGAERPPKEEKPRSQPSEEKRAQTSYVIKKARPAKGRRATTQSAAQRAKLAEARRRAMASLRKGKPAAKKPIPRKGSGATSRPTKSFLTPRQGPGHPMIGRTGPPHMRMGKQAGPVPGKTPVRPNLKPPVTDVRRGGHGIPAAQKPRTVVRPAARPPVQSAGPKVKPPAGVKPGVKPPAKPAGGAPTDQAATAKSAVADTKTTLVFTTEPPDPETQTYRFEYDKTPWPDVLADFSRVSGLPLVNISGEMTGNLTYRSSEKLSFIEALHKLNWLLQQQPLSSYVIQREDGYLIVGNMPDLVRRIPPEKMFETFAEFEAAHLDPYDVCLTHIEVPPGWTPFEVLDEFRTKFSDTYGTQISGQTTIELTGLAKEHELFKEVLDKLAKGQKPLRESDQPKMVVKLKAAKAADVQTLLRQWYPVSGPAVARRGKRRQAVAVDPMMERAKRLTIVSDIKNNVLYIRGPQHLLEEVRRTIDNIDVGEWRPPVQDVVQLNTAAANTVVQTLKPIFAKQNAALAKTNVWIPQAMKDALACDIFANTSSNAVILYGGKEGVARARQLVEQYDVPPDWVNEIIELQHADAADAASTILANLPAAGRGMPQPTITPRSSTTLLVSCSKQNYQKVLDLVAKLDVPDVEKPREHFVALEYAKPSDLAQTLQQMMPGSNAPPARRSVVRRRLGKKGARRVPVRRQVAAAPGRGPVFIPDDAAGTLIVFCSDKDWAKAEPLIQQLDSLAGKVKPVMRSVELHNADAADVAAMLNQMYPPRPGGGQTAEQQMVTADAYNNTINIFAKPDFIEKVLPLIQRLDINQTAPMTVIPLRYCKAEVITPILSEIFPGGGGAVRAKAPVSRRKGVRAKLRALSSPAATGEAGVRIVAEPVTNSLVVTAPPKVMQQIRDRVADMETEAEKVATTQVIVVAENRPATEIADTLNSLLGSAAPQARRPKGRPSQPSAENPVAEPLKIIPVGERIILKGPQNKVAQAIQLVNRIDVDDQQPISRKIKVLDAE